jgi:dTDP-4-amino-4,6-dideoxygalactose transaminase
MIWPVSRRTIHLDRGDWAVAAALGLGGQFLDGPCIGEFESAFARRVGARHAIATGPGRLALRLILEALDLPRGGEVLMPAYEDASVPEAIREVGLVPVCVDIDPRTQNIDPDAIERRLSPETAAIVVAHIFGIPFDVSALRARLGERRIPIIEDCAHAVGTTHAGRHVGGSGDAALFSFHTTKPFPTLGGGMVVTNSDALAEYVRLRVAGLPLPPRKRLARRFLVAAVTRFLSSRMGFAVLVYPWLRLASRVNVALLDIYNRTLRRLIRIYHTDTRFTNVQARIGLRKLDRLDEAVARRRAHMATLEAALGDRVERPRPPAGGNGYFYTVYAAHRDKVRRRLLTAGIDTGKDLMRNCAEALGQGEDCPVTARVTAQSLQVPVYEQLSDACVARMADILRGALTASCNT